MPEKSKFLCEYITQILSDNKKVNGEIKINFANINNKRMLTFDIDIPNRDFESFNTGVTTQQVDVLTEQILNDLIDNFMELETMGCTRYYSIRGGYGMNMDGVNVINNIGSRIKVNFICRGDKFIEQVENYNSRLNEYINQQKTSAKSK